MIPEQLLTGAITEKPLSFLVGSTRYYLYPPSLGVHLLTHSLLERMGVDTDLLAIDPDMELLRLATLHRDSALRLIAINSLKGYAEVQNETKVQRRIRALGRGLTASEVASLLAFALKSDGYEDLTRHYGIEQDREERERIGRIKGDKSMLTLGGRTLYGGLIDFVCQRYGWTLDYCVWGISYLNLKMLSSDASLSVYLSEEEQKQYHSHRAIVSADDPANRDYIRQYLSE